MNTICSKNVSTLLQVSLVAILMLVSTVLAANDAHQLPVLDDSVGDNNQPQFLKFFSNVHVNCTRGASIQQYLNVLPSHSKLTIHGTCNEQILINKDGITIIGADGASINGGGVGVEVIHEGVVTIQGARGVTLKNLAVNNGPDTGIYASAGAQITLNNVSASGHATTGIVVDNAQAELNDVSANDNGSVGIDAFSSSTVIAKGSITTNRNAGPGLEANGNSLIELRGAIVTSNENGGDGVLLVADSLLQILSFPESQGSGVTAEGNAGNGMLIATSELVVVGSQYEGSGANEFNLNNNGNGIFISSGAINNPFGTAKFSIQHNDIGILAVDGAQILSIGGLNISENGAGLVGDAAGTFTIVSIPPNPSSIQGNHQDVDLSFGTRATFGGTEIGSINCDTTALVRGSTTCP